MATTAVTLNGVTYFVPQPGEQGPTYDQDLTNYLVALATAFPQGGASPSSTFQALVSATANPATAGAIRLGKTDLINWRNQANLGNDSFGVDANDNLTYTSSAAAPAFWSGLAQQLTGQCYAEYTTTAGQSIPNAANTVINYGTVVTDTDSAVTTGAAWKFTVPTGKGGRYLVSATACLGASQAGAAPGRLEMALFKNGAEVANNEISPLTSVLAINSVAYNTSIINCAAGDFLQAIIFQSSGAGAGSVALSATATRNRIIVQRLV